MAANEVSVPPGAYIEVGGAVLEPGAARGALATPQLDVSWDLRFTDRAAAFRHLPYEFLYARPPAEDEAALTRPGCALQRLGGGRR